MMLITSTLYLPCKGVPCGMCIVLDILWLKQNSVRSCWLIEAVLPINIINSRKWFVTVSCYYSQTFV